MVPFSEHEELESGAPRVGLCWAQAPSVLGNLPGSAVCGGAGCDPAPLAGQEVQAQRRPAALRSHSHVGGRDRRGAGELTWRQGDRKPGSNGASLHPKMEMKGGGEYKVRSWFRSLPVAALPDAHAGGGLSRRSGGQTS